MVGVLVAKRIHAIGTRAEHDVPCITFKIPIEAVQRSPLASILDVSQLRIISIVGLLPLMRASALALLPWDLQNTSGDGE